MSVDSLQDTSSPMSPYERPIRPLPKRRLRERLCPEVADQIQYPPTPSSSTTLFYPSYTIREEVNVAKVVDLSRAAPRRETERRDYVSRRIGEDIESEEEEAVYQGRVYDRRTADPTGRSYRYVQKIDSKQSGGNGLTSVASSVDSYDSFENNNNNKKKRKIPGPGENGVHLSIETTGVVGDDQLEDAQGGLVAYHTPSVSSHGLSGPGRGRYGRNRSGRSPLRTLSDSSGSWGNSRTKPRPQWSSQSESPGIISRSIANANAERFPILPANGQENLSLLHQQASKKPSTTTQFTFTCDSQIPGTIPWPNTKHAPIHPDATRTTNSTQTVSTMPGRINQSASAGHVSQNHTTGQTRHPPSNQANTTPQPRKPRRKPGKEYLIAARTRREQQEFRNFHHPPTLEEMWICEFCEYERIFGTPPEALIRQYEIKDRKARKQEAERRRLLEKAKMKGRKGKKGSKAGSKAQTAPQNHQSTHHQDQRPPPVQQNSNSQDTQSDGYYDEGEYYNGYHEEQSPARTDVHTGKQVPADYHNGNQQLLNEAGGGGVSRGQTVT